jgi:hypothetical protein
MTCGDFGGLTVKGEPCKRAAGWGVPDSDSGRCKTHLEQEPEPFELVPPIDYVYRVDVRGSVDAATAVLLTPYRDVTPPDEEPTDPVDPDPDPVDPDPDPEPVDPDPDPYVPSDRHPNEFAGAVPFFDHDFGYWPESREGIAGFPASHTGWIQFNGVNATDKQFGITPDPDGPHGYKGYVRALWHAGKQVGTGVWNWTARNIEGSAAEVMAGTLLRKAYISFWVYLEPEDDGMWETHFDQFRMFTVNRHVTGSYGGRTTMGFTFRGVLRYEGTSVRWVTGEPKRMSALRDYRYWGYKCDGCSSATLANAGPGMPLGQWVHHEIIIDRTVKTDGPMFGTGTDGEGPVHIQHWANGALLLDRVVTTYMAFPLAEIHVNLNQSGGIAPSVDKYIRWTGLYISGEPY